MSIRLSGMISGMDTDAMVKELVSAYSLKKEGFEKQSTKLGWKQEQWKELNSKIYKFYTGALYNMKMATSFSNKKSTVVSDSTKAAVTANGKVPNGTQTIEINELAKAAYVTGSKLTRTGGEKIEPGTTTMSQLGITGGGSLKVQTKDGEKTVLVHSGEKVSDFLKRFETETGITASFDSGQQRFIMNSESGEENDFKFMTDTAENFATLSKLGLATEQQYIDKGEPVPAKVAYKQDATDSQIIINGAMYESASNTVSVNGLSVTATGITDRPISVTTSTDVDGIYNMVKDFMKEYNSLVNEMTELYNAPTSKGYEPLTAEEKDAMSETQIEQWEEKIKDSLFRRDDTMNSVMSAMQMSMSQGIKVGGKTLYLSSFGISTMGFSNSKENQQNAYHIDGDKDDEFKADSKDKLRAAIESDPNQVAEFFSKMGESFYDTMTKKMTSTELRSAYTVYNDKELTNQQIDLKKQIESWEEKITKYEESWYKKFSAMETAMAKLQSQTASLTSMLGGK